MRIALVGAECEENLALRYIRGALERAGHFVLQITFNSEDEIERAARELAESKTKLAGFSMVFTYRAREFADLAARARQMGYIGHITAGGHFVAFNADSVLRDVPALDSIVVGEGEEPMCELADHLAAPEAVRGLVRRNSVGEIVHNEPAVKPSELDTLAWPIRKQPPDAFLGLPIVNMLSSRGCTHSCAFCSIAAWHKLCGGARFRMRAPEAVAEEMASLYDQGFRIFNFHDDNFFLGSRAQNFERARKLEGELRRRGVGRIAFAVKSRPDSVDKELFAYLKEIGLFRVFLGIESGSAASLAYLGRCQTVEDNARAIETVNALKIHACYNLLLLNPDSTLDEFLTNVAFLRAHSGNPMNFCRTEIYSGTPLETRLRDEGRLRGSYWGYTYRISDERAQQVFEIIYRGLIGRNYGNDCTHHLTMRVDYEMRLLEHFFGCPAHVRRQVKNFIQRVNLNSCDYLAEIADAAGRGFRSDDARAQYVSALVLRVKRNNDKFAAESELLLNAIRRAAMYKRPDNLAWQQKAAAAMIATIALAGTSCFERAPVPPNAQQPVKPANAFAGTSSGQQSFHTEMVAMPPEAFEGNTAKLSANFRNNVLKQLAAAVQPAIDVEFEFWVDEYGEVTYLNVSEKLSNEEQKKVGNLIADLGANDFKTSDAAVAELKKMGPGVLPQLKEAVARAEDLGLKKRMEDIAKEVGRVPVIRQSLDSQKLFKEQSFKDKDLRFKRFVLKFTAQELEKARGAVIMPTPYMTEMAPVPPVPPRKKDR
jgi:anaerobic magnesium-protoporphyrin IX monomethyl ester cyclase